jgi:hypothetical protein
MTVLYYVTLILLVLNIQNHKCIKNLRTLKLGGKYDVLLGGKLVKKLFPNFM